MSWAKLADNFHSHPKTLRMGLDGAGLYGRGLSYAACHLTDGFLPDEWVNAHPKNVVKKLIDVGAWEKTEGGFLIVDYLDYNPARSEVEKKRRATNARVTRYRDRGNASETENGTRSNADPVPDPYPLLPSIEGDISKGSGFDVGRFVEELSDADGETESVLRALKRDLPEAAFHTALESLRRRRQEKPPLVSEKRYFVAALASMKREGQYA